LKYFQWVIVNDAGHKVEVQAIADYATRAGLNVMLLHKEQSTGLADASNYGIKHSDSNYIHIHDDDSVEPSFDEKKSVS